MIEWGEERGVEIETNGRLSERESCTLGSKEGILVGVRVLLDLPRLFTEKREEFDWRGGGRKFEEIHTLNLLVN